MKMYRSESKVMSRIAVVERTSRLTNLRQFVLYERRSASGIEEIYLDVKF